MSQVEVEDRDDVVLDYTQGVLRSLTDDILKEGIDKVGEDDRKMLLVALKDMSSTAIGRKRIKVEERVADSAEGASAVIAEILRHANVGQHFEMKEVGPKRVVKLGAEIPEPTFLPGETDINAAQMDVESFMARTSHLVEPADE